MLLWDCIDCERSWCRGKVPLEFVSTSLLAKAGSTAKLVIADMPPMARSGS